MHWKGSLENDAQLQQVHTMPGHYTAGFAIGIIAVHLIYPKLPGNVANATTYRFPVLYQEVDFDIEQLFAGDDSIRDIVVEAAKELERQGVRAIVGACGYFAHFQQDVAEAVQVPVFLSSLCQIPMIRLGLSAHQKILVLAASGDQLDDALLHHVGTGREGLLIQNIGDMDSFDAIRYGKTTLDNGRLTEDLCRLAAELQRQEPDIGAILLECSDLPPYAKAIQSVTGLPVFDFNTMINWLYHSVVQTSYYGYF